MRHWSGSHRLGNSAEPKLLAEARKIAALAPASSAFQAKLCISHPEHPQALVLRRSRSPLRQRLPGSNRRRVTAASIASCPSPRGIRKSFACIPIKNAPGFFWGRCTGVPVRPNYPSFYFFGVDHVLFWWEKVGRSGGKWLFRPLLEPCPKPPRNRSATPGLSRGPWMRRIVSRFRRRG